MVMQWTQSIEQSVEALELIDHVEDLKRDGLTIVPPGKTGFSIEDVEVARAALLDLSLIHI